jgi:hypothetical protein
MQLLLTLFMTLVIRHHPSCEGSEQTNFSAYVITYQLILSYSQLLGQNEGTSMARVVSVSSAYLYSFHI